MKYIIIAMILIGSVHAQTIKVKDIYGNTVEIDTTNTRIKAAPPLQATYLTPTDILIWMNQLEARSSATDYNIDSAIKAAVVDQVSRIKIGFDTAFVKAYIDILLNAKRSPAPKSQRIEAITGQKRFQFVLPNYYVLFVDGKLFSLDKDYTQDGNVFITKRAVKKGGIVRLINLD